jgi:CheY-like chemotaxis protein
MSFQTSFKGISALIIDDMSVQQQTLKTHLGLLGITHANTASTPDEALRLIKSRRYGLILCDYNLNQKTDGQQLFEHLRESRLLPPDCLFFMITAESGYGAIASAIEHHPDAYLLKPTTASDIADRLKAQLEKRQALLAITQKQFKDDLVGVLVECDKVMGQQNRWFMQALQIKGETLLKLGKNDEARAAYKSALDKRADLVWAQLGLALARKAAGQFEEAKHLAESIIQSREGEKNMAAYDLMAEALEAQGDTQSAMYVLRDAATVLPSARRHRIAGESAYRNGDLESAKDSLAKVAKATKGSMIAQTQDTLLLAQTMVDLGDTADAIKLP